MRQGFRTGKIQHIKLHLHCQKTIIPVHYVLCVVVVPSSRFADDTVIAWNIKIAPDIPANYGGKGLQ